MQNDMHNKKWALGRAEGEVWSHRFSPGILNMGFFFYTVTWMKKREFQSGFLKLYQGCW